MNATLLTIKAEAILQRAMKVREVRIKNNRDVTLNPIVKNALLIDFISKSISGKPNRIAPGAAMEYVSSRILLEMHNQPIKETINILKTTINKMEANGGRINLWMAMACAEMLLDISINRKRALRRQGIDGLEHIADTNICRLACKLFDIDHNIEQMTYFANINS